MKIFDDRNELYCEHCGQSFHYDHKRHCWQCDSITCPICSSSGENLCPECRRQVLPETIEPMLATTGKLPAHSEQWAYEFKWDGIRALTHWNGKTLRIESRNLLNITYRYPEFSDLGKYLGENAIVDGEIIALDEHNRPSFSMLQKRMHISAAKVKWSLPKVRVYYYLFDLLFLNGEDFMDAPYTRRREVLESLNFSHARCKIPPAYYGSGQTILSVAKEHHLEGILCKRMDSPYRPGTRSDNWIKVKLVKSREFVIGGFKYTKDTTKKIGSLQLGAYDDHMNLHFVGSTGTGFSADDHAYLLSILEPIRTETCPFAEDVDKTVQYTQPIYVAEVEYRRWPKNGLVQQCAYKGIRTEKSPAHIHLQEP